MNVEETLAVDSQVTRGYGLLEGFLAKQRCRIANRLIPDVLRTGRLLDIGCGTSPLFLSTTTFKERYGFDKVVDASNGHQQGGGALQLITHDLEATLTVPFESGYFDVVTMLAVFEHLEPARLVPILKEIHRVLRPGGLYVLTTPAKWTDRLLRTLAAVKIVSPVEIAEHKDVYTHAKIAGLLEAGHFNRAKLRFGYFECFMNLWAVAQK